jgi:hypothetical protein
MGFLKGVLGTIGPIGPIGPIGLLIVLLLVMGGLAIKGAAAQTVEQLKAMDRTQKEYVDCVAGAAKRYARQLSEPAATIAEGALGACQTTRASYIKATQAIGTTVEGAQNAARVLDERLRPWTISLVLELRGQAPRKD